MPELAGHYPYQSPITAYGNGGFRFADMSHRGSILCLPSGIYAWEPTSAAGLKIEDFARLLTGLSAPCAVLLGTGTTQVWPSQDIAKAFADLRLGLEPMATGAAARTYNILLAERRPIAAALIAVD